MKTAARLKRFLKPQKGGGEPDGRLACSFCGRDQQQAEKLIAGPDNAYICDRCVELCDRIILEEREQKCSFCGLSGAKSEMLVGGFTGRHDVRVCDKCIELCNEIIEEEQSQGRQ